MMAITQKKIYKPQAQLIEAQTRVELFKLFILFDTTQDERVITSEVVYALNNYCGLNLPPGQVANIMEEVAHASNQTIVSEETMLEMDSNQFALFMSNKSVFGCWQGEERLAKVRSAKEALHNSWALNNKNFFNGLKSAAIKSPVSPSEEAYYFGAPDKEGKEEDAAKNFKVFSEGCCDWMKYIWLKFRLSFVFAVLAWLFAGTAILILVNQWNFSQSVYYSIQSGFSIGFGILNEMKEYGINHVDKCSDFTTISEGRNWIQNSGLDLVGDFTSHSKYSASTSYKSCVYVYSDNKYKNYSMAYTIVSFLLDVAFDRYFVLFWPLFLHGCSFIFVWAQVLSPQFSECSPPPLSKAHQAGTKIQKRSTRANAVTGFTSTRLASRLSFFGWSGVVLAALGTRCLKTQVL